MKMLKWDLTLLSIFKKYWNLSFHWSTASSGIRRLKLKQKAGLEHLVMPDFQGANLFSSQSNDKTV